MNTLYLDIYHKDHKAIDGEHKGVGGPEDIDDIRARAEASGCPVAGVPGQMVSVFSGGGDWCHHWYLGSVS